MDGGNGHEQ